MHTNEDNERAGLGVNRGMRAAALLLLIPLAIAQNRPEDLASVEGQVLDLASGGALRKVSVVLIPANGTPGGEASQGYSTSTDDSGNFAMTGIPPGRYRLTFSHNGYVSGQYGARGAGRQGQILSLDKGQRLTGLSVKLAPQGVVTGKIVDREGDPVYGVWVQALRYRYQAGQKTIESTVVAITNDLGEYRLFGIAPGKYFLSASNQRNMSPANQTTDRSAGGLPSEDFVPTYYPGTADLSTAGPLTVLAGAQLRADWTLEKARVAKVSGVVENAAGPGAPTVTLRSRGPVGGALGGQSARVGPDGKFEFSRVVPGSYTLIGSASVDGMGHSAEMRVDVAGSDVEDLRLTIPPYLSVNGRVRVEGDSTLKVSAVRVGLLPAEGGAVMGRLARVNISEDGTLVMDQINPGIYRVQVEGLPQGFYVKSEKVGGTDVLGTGLDLTGGSVDDLEIVLSPYGGQVVGLVQDATGMQPVAGATVALIPQEKERREQGRDYRTTTTDQAGGFNLTSVVPGEYRIYAWEDIDPGAYFDPDFMQPFETQGQALTVHEKDQAMLQLTVIPAAQ